jgi:putative PIN family toxin of toxin-antitoxin system
MKFVFDTNIVVAGLLWNGKPRRLLDKAIDGSIECFTSEALLIELERVLQYPRLQKQLSMSGFGAREWCDQYRSLATPVTPSAPIQAIARDPDDDQVLACAVAAGVRFIVSGDQDLLSLKEHQSILVVTADEALRILDKAS